MYPGYNIIEILAITAAGVWLFVFFWSLFTEKKPMQFLEKSFDVIKQSKSSLKALLIILAAYLIMRSLDNDEMVPLYIFAILIFIWIVSWGISFWAQKPNEFVDWSWTHLKKYWGLILLFFVTAQLCTIIIIPRLS